MKMASADANEVNESPKKGPTLSTSTSSFEALNSHDPNLSQLATNMFKKTEDYIAGEVMSSQDVYKRIFNMNQVSFAKYNEYRAIVNCLSKNIAKLEEVYSLLLPDLEKVEEIEKCVVELEKMAKEIDMYSKKLEAKYKNIPK